MSMFFKQVEPSNPVVIVDKDYFEELKSYEKEHNDNEYDASAKACKLLEEYLNTHHHEIKDLKITIGDNEPFNVTFNGEWEVDPSPYMGTISFNDEASNEAHNIIQHKVLQICREIAKDEMRTPRALFAKYFAWKTKLIKWLVVFSLLSFALNIAAIVCLFVA